MSTTQDCISPNEGVFGQNWIHWALQALALAASPTFAIMALLNIMLGSSSMAMICSTGQSGQIISGMVPMYLLMSAFHLAAWLKLAAGRGN